MSSDTTTPEWSLREPAASWLLPLDGSPSGEDLEYDPAMFELDKAAAGKPETQFSAAEPPNWNEVVNHAVTVMGRTRDLRVAMWWCRGMLHNEGLIQLPHVLALLGGLLENFWDTLHPALDPDDGDAFSRVAVLGSMANLDGMLGDLRQALLATDRALGSLHVRDVEVALEKLAPRADESPRTAGQLRGMFNDLPEISARLRQACEQSLAQIKRLVSIMNDRFGFENTIDTKPMRQMVEGVLSILPEPAVEQADDEVGDEVSAEADGSTPAPSRARGGVPGSIDSRADAIKALQLVCAYLERHEPTNPAQLLLRRAERLMQRNFLQLLHDLAPDALDQVAKMMGVDPNSITDED